MMYFLSSFKHSQSGYLRIKTTYGVWNWNECVCVCVFNYFTQKLIDHADGVTRLFCLK